MKRLIEAGHLVANNLSQCTISKSQSTIESSQSVEYTGPRDFRNKQRLLHHDLLSLIDKGLVGILYKVFLVTSA